MRGKGTGYRFTTCAKCGRRVRRRNDGQPARHECQGREEENMTDEQTAQRLMEATGQDDAAETAARLGVDEGTVRAARNAQEKHLARWTYTHPDGTARTIESSAMANAQEHIVGELEAEGYRESEQLIAAATITEARS